MTDRFFTAADHGLVARIRLTPKASANKVGAVEQSVDGQNLLKVFVTAVPEAGKANRALLKLLSKAWGLPKSSMTIVQGLTDRNKVIEIEGCPKTLSKQLERWMTERP